jgi:rubrerythrin
METLATRFFDQLVSTPAGRQHMLSLSVDAEEGDESGIFEQLVEWVVDPDLRSIVQRHRDDEARHALLFRECLARTGLEKQETPSDLKIVRRIADIAGAPLDGIRRRADAVARCALLLAIEERGVEQFPLIAEAFRAVEPDIAEVYLQVTRDERRHVKYSSKIGRRFSDTDTSWRLAVERARQIEAEAFVQVGLANVNYCTEHGWVDLP